MIKIKHLALSGLLSLSLTATADPIRIAIDGSYAPFAVIDAAGQLQGFDVDIANALCKEMKADCKLVSQNWDGMIPGLKVRKYDAIISSMSITEERLRVVDFSNRYYSNTLAFIGAKGRSFQLDQDGLKGLSVGAYRSTISSQYLEDNYQGIVDIKLYDSQDLAYMDLKSNRIDLLVSDKFPVYNWIKSNDGNGFEFKGDDIDINDQIAIAIRKGSPLKARFNTAIDKIRENGVYQQINARYFPFSIY